MGGSFMTILTGSMTPSIPPGHIVVNVPVDTADLRVGDVIAYMPKDTSRTGNLPITHRVQALHKNGKGEVAAIITKGDANPAADNPITPSQVQSKTVFVIPYLGYPNVWSFFHGTPNLQVLTLGALVIYLSCSTVAGWVRKAGSKRSVANEAA
jgi:signal peptidase